MDYLSLGQVPICGPVSCGSGRGDGQMTRLPHQFLMCPSVGQLLIEGTVDKVRAMIHVWLYILFPLLDNLSSTILARCHMMSYIIVQWFYLERGQRMGNRHDQNPW